MRKLLSLLLYINFFSPGYGQELTGLWKGNYGGSFFMPKPQMLSVELFLFNDSLLTGATHLYYRNNKYEHYKISGIFHKKDSTVVFKEDSVLALKLGFLEDNCMGNYTLKLSVNDTALKLTGRWKDNSRALFHCPSSTVFLEKRLLHIDSAKPYRSQDSPPANQALSRTPDIQSLVEIKKADKDSIKIELYDNGEIDNDTVSVYLNDEVIVSRKRISLVPIVCYLNAGSLDKIDKVKLVAESLGAIPPCTAVMIITTKSRRYEVNLSSNFNKNGIVELFLKE